MIWTGQAVTEASGRVGNEQVLWDDVDPWVGDAESQTSSMKPTDTTIRVGFTDVATTDVDAEKDEFFEPCSAADEDVADFVVG
ncbi:hypothetical protein [Streptomyces griseoloalbus]|uniref:Uncharacterized protein n=1 Tax=Streptomyces griseoloalbus TaxID=67303 RepID=A0A7W8BKV0_9ACTN|nr:hypothetical protein [Streptomyces albaduncus]MBB5125245.1 hypothetical protein [Streptomyces albaduncus]GGW29038.1 hypothetical protein GCM10010340_03350 [Streptomyces albaduncus]